MILRWDRARYQVQPPAEKEGIAAPVPRDDHSKVFVVPAPVPGVTLNETGAKDLLIVHSHAEVDEITRVDQWLHSTQVRWQVIDDRAEMCFCEYRAVFYGVVLLAVGRVLI